MRLCSLNEWQFLPRKQCIKERDIPVILHVLTKSVKVNVYIMQYHRCKSGRAPSLLTATAKTNTRKFTFISLEPDMLYYKYITDNTFWDFELWNRYFIHNWQALIHLLMYHHGLSNSIQCDYKCCERLHRFIVNKLKATDKQTRCTVNI